MVVALASPPPFATAAADPRGDLVAGLGQGGWRWPPRLEELRQLRQPERTQVYDRQGRVIEVLKDEADRIVVPLSKISPTLQQAVVAAEDAPFYEHKGVDDLRDRRAAGRRPCSSGQPGRQHHHPAARPQQLRRPEGHLDRPQGQEGRPRRPARTKLSQDEILHRYLNQVADTAVSRRPAGHTSAAAPPRSPWPRRPCSPGSSRGQSLDPRHHPERAKQLRDSVLERMTLGMIDPAQAAKAKKQPLQDQAAQRRPCP